ncbi:TPA: hypothetical protein DCZ32_04665, partial [Candidatus Uhrbacteria bacterium]|nr:hypothetical protein [Candidatus Uhrbacteria bacterium]
MGYTKKQTAVLKFIQDHINEHGYTPSYREIASNLGISSPSTIHSHIQSLVEKGALQMNDDGIEIITNQETRITAPSILLPLAGLITAGEPIEAVEQNDLMAVPADLVLDESNSYILKVKGRSMIEDGI